MRIEPFDVRRLREARRVVAATRPREPVRKETKAYLLELADWLERICGDPARWPEVAEFWRLFQLFQGFLETEPPAGRRRVTGRRRRRRTSRQRRRRRRQRHSQRPKARPRQGRRPRA